jgi:hypothetical protein
MRQREPGGRTSETTIEAGSNEAAFTRCWANAHGCIEEEVRRVDRPQKER